MNKHTVFLSIGANVGNRLLYIEAAIHALQQNKFDIKSKSRVWETMPWGKKDQPRFLNMCLVAETSIPWENIISTIKQIEKHIGRNKAEPWGPREIDIDIIFIDDIVFESDEFTIPHKLMHERAFVLRPLSEIAPDKLHPQLGKSVKDLFETLPEEKMEWIMKL